MRANPRWRERSNESRPGTLRAWHWRCWRGSRCGSSPRTGRGFFSPQKRGGGGGGWGGDGGGVQKGGGSSSGLSGQNCRSSQFFVFWGEGFFRLLLGYGPLFSNRERQGVLGAQRTVRSEKGTETSYLDSVAVRGERERERRRERWRASERERERERDGERERACACFAAGHRR